MKVKGSFRDIGKNPEVVVLIGLTWLAGLDPDL